MPLTSYEDLNFDKKTEEKVKLECFPESFMKEFSADNEDVKEELKTTNENLEFSVLAA